MREKIKSLPDLSKKIQELKAQGKKVVQCHGCFDLLHVGHIKHLNAAKNLGDVLVVTLTPDRFVNKGPGRPLFNQDLRLEQMSSLQCVDFVALNDHPDAIDLIKKLQPNLYVKGDEYKDAEKDVTGKILLEKQAVEEGGGELAFTELPTFSSTELINGNFKLFPDDVHAYISGFKKKFSLDQIVSYVEKFRDLKVLVVGDVIIDEYTYCHVSGTVSKYPTLAAIYDQTVRMLGGSLAIARHVKGFVQQADVFSWVGDQNDGEAFIREDLKKEGVGAHFFVWKGQPTVTKRRFITAEYPNPLSKTDSINPKGTRLFEIGYLPRNPMPPELAAQAAEQLSKIAGNYDIIIVADFGHGLMTPPLIEAVQNSKVWYAVNAQTNSSNFGFNRVTKYKNPHFVCIDELEARLPFGDRLQSVSHIAENLLADLKTGSLMITRGRKGLALYGAGDVCEVPPFATSIVDTVGSGDAVLSLASLSKFVNHPPEVTGFLGAISGAVACQIPGNLYPVQKASLHKFIQGLLK